MAELEKKIPSRITLKHDTEAKWKEKTDFIPLNSEMIVYDEDSLHDYKRFKVGDGKTSIDELPFATISEAELTERLAEFTEQINQNDLQVGETQPAFACTWFRVKSNS